MTVYALFAAVFLACVVEAIEATTIVVAAGATRNWRSALTGTVLAVIALAVIVTVLGPSIMLLPINILRIVVGSLLLIFGLQWLQKAVLRASGVKALHDEAEIYQRKVAEAQAAQTRSRFGVSDWYAFTLAFKGTLLEGLEVVFIVLTFATNEGHLGVAVVAALLAIVLVVIVGVIVRGPLTKVPENTLKFVVGIMLTSFGIFWGAEGVGVEWPGSDAALLVLAPSILVYCLLLMWYFRSRRIRGESAASPVEPAGEPVAGDVPLPAGSGGVAVAVETTTETKTKPGRLKAFGLFWYDFIIGDDWQVAAGVVAMLVVLALTAAWSLAWVVAAVALAVLIPYGTFRAARR